MKKLPVMVAAVLAGLAWSAPAAPKFDWKPAQAQSAAAGKIGRPVTLTNSIGMKFVLIPAGGFMMGSPPGEPHRFEAEGPRHRVVISRSFYLQTTEVTQTQYRAIMGRNPSKFKGCDQCPVENVSWNKAREFIRRLNAREGTNQYRLPTEAEWEYACRAGTTTPFAFGNTISMVQDSYDAYYRYKGIPMDGYSIILHFFRLDRQTTPVGSFPPNRWGLHDIHGNVAEWCADWYGGDYYKKSPQRDPRGPSFGGIHALRGGWRNNAPWVLRSASRHSVHPRLRGDVGFRVARSVSF